MHSTVLDEGHKALVPTSRRHALERKLTLWARNGAGKRDL